MMKQIQMLYIPKHRKVDGVTKGRMPPAFFLGGFFNRVLSVEYQNVGIFKKSDILFGSLKIEFAQFDVGFVNKKFSVLQKQI